MAERTGVQRIAEERQRQIEVEGWTPGHDDCHDDGELALAAVCYAAPVPLYRRERIREGGLLFTDPWPETWGPEWDKREHDVDGTPVRARTTSDRIRQLEKAGALVAAEIDRLLRREASRG